MDRIILVQFPQKGQILKKKKHLCIKELQFSEAQNLGRYSTTTTMF